MAPTIENARLYEQLRDQDRRKEEGSKEPSSAPTLADSLRIMVVDDNVDGAEMLTMLLTLAGHATEAAHTSPSALEAAQVFQPQVMFLDIGLPGPNGYEVAQRLRSDPATSGVLLMALTGWGTEDDRRRAQEVGFDHHLTSSFRYTDYKNCSQKSR